MQHSICATTAAAAAAFFLPQVLCEMTASDMLPTSPLFAPCLGVCADENGISCISRYVWG